MRILFLTNIFPNPYEPLKGTFNLEMVKSLSEQHDVDVVCPVSWVEKSRAKSRSPVAISSARVTVRYPTYFYTPKVFRRFYASFLSWSVRGALSDAVRNRRPDIVLSYWVHPDGAVALRFARTLGVPGVVMIGGSDVLLFTANPMRRRVIVGTLHEADAIITVSDNLKAKLTGFGIPPEKVTVVTRGVDATKFAPADRAAARRRLQLADDARHLVWVGRMVPVKGLPLLLEACADLKRRGIAFCAHLIGSGPDRAALGAQVAALGLERHVSFPGAVAHDDLPDWYRAADLVVLPSLSEGTPNVLLEAIACDTPFVASAVGGIPEIASDGIDTLVAPGDASALAAAIACALQRRPVLRDRRFAPGSQSAASARISRVLADVVAGNSADPASASVYAQVVGS